VSFPFALFESSVLFLPGRWWGGGGLLLVDLFRRQGSLSARQRDGTFFPPLFNHGLHPFLCFSHDSSADPKVIPPLFLEKPRRTMITAPPSLSPHPTGPPSLFLEPGGIYRTFFPHFGAEYGAFPPLLEGAVVFSFLPPEPPRDVVGHVCERTKAVFPFSFRGSHRFLPPAWAAPFPNGRGCLIGRSRTLLQDDIFFFFFTKIPSLRPPIT